MFTAIERAAEQRTLFVNGASGGAKVYASPVRIHLEGKDAVSGSGINQDAMAVGCDIITPIRMKEERLARAAALGATIARHGGLLIERQT